MRQGDPSDFFVRLAVSNHQRGMKRVASWLIVALLIGFVVGLTGLGLFGVTDHLISMPGWEEVKKSTLTDVSPSSPLGNALKDYVDSLDRSRNIAFILSLVSLIGGLGLGGLVCRAYMRRRSAGGSLFPFNGGNPAGAGCTICGVKLSPGAVAGGVCDFCRKRAG
jgi:hypothetical protein